MIIRKATVWDVPEMVEMWEKTLEIACGKEWCDALDTNVLFAALVARVLHPTWIILVAGEPLAGMIMGEIRNEKYRPGKKFVFAEVIYVNDKYRGSGVDSKLMKASREIAIEHGAMGVEFAGPIDALRDKYWRRTGHEPTYTFYRGEFSLGGKN